ncbi:MAG: class I tRNA ligase family protein, partial [Deltaproteobacteria bacterium]|nr:class I tRNA ligase family protein [Deltaproteobacteria bacterium]
MSMTITEKILAAHAGVETVTPGELIICQLDLVMGNDVTAPISIDILKKEGIETVFDAEKIALIPDHYVPNKDILSAELCKTMREFARKHNVKYYFEVGEMGVEHALLPEQGIVVPGDCMIGADSHTCTYGALGAFSTGVGSTDLAAAMISGETWFKVPESMKFIYYGELPKWVSGKDIILYTIDNIGEEQNEDEELRLAFDTLMPSVVDHYEKYDLNKALEEIWGYLSRVNKYLATHEPWKIAKNSTQKERLGRILYQAAASLRAICPLIFPVMPESMEKIWNLLGEEHPIEDTRLSQFDYKNFGLDRSFIKPEPLFPRVKLEDFLKEEKMELVTFDEFKKMDFRVGEILKVEH